MKNGNGFGVVPVNGRFSRKSLEFKLTNRLGLGTGKSKFKKCVVDLSGLNGSSARAVGVAHGFLEEYFQPSYNVKYVADGEQTTDPDVLNDVDSAKLAFDLDTLVSSLEMGDKPAESDFQYKEEGKAPALRWYKLLTHKRASKRMYGLVELANGCIGPELEESPLQTKARSIFEWYEKDSKPVNVYAGLLWQLSGDNKDARANALYELSRLYAKTLNSAKKYAEKAKTGEEEIQAKAKQYRERAKIIRSMFKWKSTHSNDELSGYAQSVYNLSAGDKAHRTIAIANLMEEYHNSTNKGAIEKLFAYKAVHDRAASVRKYARTALNRSKAMVPVHEGMVIKIY